MLKKITSRLYAYNNGQGTRYMLEYGDVGVYGFGECYRLSMTENGNKQYLGCFITKDDGHGIVRKSVDGMLWTNIKDILDYAENIIIALN